MVMRNFLGVKATLSTVLEHSRSEGERHDRVSFATLSLPSSLPPPDQKRHSLQPSVLKLLHIRSRDSKLLISTKKRAQGHVSTSAPAGRRDGPIGWTDRELGDQQRSSRPNVFLPLNFRVLRLLRHMGGIKEKRKGRGEGSMGRRRTGDRKGGGWRGTSLARGARCSSRPKSRSRPPRPAHDLRETSLDFFPESAHERRLCQINAQFCVLNRVRVEHAASGQARQTFSRSTSLGEANLMRCCASRKSREVTKKKER